MDRLLAIAACLVRYGREDSSDRVPVDKIFPRDIANVLHRHFLQPLRPSLDVGGCHAGGEPPAVVPRHTRLAVLGIDEFGEIGVPRAVQLVLRNAVLA